MITRKAIGLLAVMFAMTFAMVQTANAQATSKIQNYFNDAAVKVRATADPVQKREILVNSLTSMSNALTQVESSGLVSEENQVGVHRFKTSLQDKLDELAGINGFAPVPDAQLNAFANYVVQDMEQAAETITISLVAALLIAIIIILLA